MRRRFPQQLTAGVDIRMRNAIDCLTGTQAIHIVLIGNGGASIGSGGQFPTILPGEGPAGTVIVAQGGAGYRCSDRK